MSTTSVDVAAPTGGEPVGFTTRLLPWVLALGGVVGLAAALVLTIEKIALIRDPGYVPSCSINPILSCGSIMSTPQSQVFGFPNPLLGIAGFAIVTTTGMVLLGGARLPRWFWLGLLAGTAFGIGFIHWLIYQSLYVIGALCPYCMIVWVITIPVFWYTTLACLHHAHLPGHLLDNAALTSLPAAMTADRRRWGDDSWPGRRHRTTDCSTARRRS